MPEEFRQLDNILNHALWIRQTVFPKFLPKDSVHWQAHWSNEVHCNFYTIPCIADLLGGETVVWLQWVAELT